MNANELVAVARLATHYEDRFPADEALTYAMQDAQTVKRNAPALWKALADSGRTDRQIGDWLYRFIGAKGRSGMTFRNFADRVLRTSGHRF